MGFAPDNQTPRPKLTPPYITAEPEVVSRDLHPSAGEQLRFLNLASDGRVWSSCQKESFAEYTEWAEWDRLTSEESALYLSAHMLKPKQDDISRAELPHMFAFSPPKSERPYPAEALPGSHDTNHGNWVFEDDNAATSLIRNTLGNAKGNRDVIRQVMSMRGPGSRGMRDDITSMCVISIVPDWDILKSLP